MYLISVQGYINASVNILKIRKTGEICEIWEKILEMVQVLQIYVIQFQKKYMVFMKKENQQKKKLRITNNELNTKSNKFVYAKNNIMTNIIKHCRGEKKEE